VPCAPGTWPLGQGVQPRAICTGTTLGYTHNDMTLNVFSAGRDLVRWEVTAVSADGPYRLGVYHPGGAIVEYFTSVSAALQRERELEGLFADRRAGYEPAAMVAGD
jgi:hypothetical protein